MRVPFLFACSLSCPKFLGIKPLEIVGRFLRDCILCQCVEFWLGCFEDLLVIKGMIWRTFVVFMLWLNNEFEISWFAKFVIFRESQMIFHEKCWFKTGQEFVSLNEKGKNGMVQKWLKIKRFLTYFTEDRAFLIKFKVFYSNFNYKSFKLYFVRNSRKKFWKFIEVLLNFNYFTSVAVQLYITKESKFEKLWNKLSF